MKSSCKCGAPAYLNIFLFIQRLLVVKLICFSYTEMISQNMDVYWRYKKCNISLMGDP